MRRFSLYEYVNRSSSSLVAGKVSRAVYPIGMKPQKQNGLILVLTLIVLSILFLMLSFGWQQFFSNAKTVAVTKQNIQSYQEMRGVLMASAYEIKNNTLGVEQAILQRGQPYAITDLLPTSIDLEKSDETTGKIEVILQRLNQGQSNTAVPVMNGEVPVLYGHMCTGNRLTNSKGTVGSGATDESVCHNMLLTVQRELPTLGGTTYIKQMVGFGIYK